MTDTPLRIPLAQLVERLAAIQSVHYEKLFAEIAKQVDSLLPEEGFEATKVALLADARAMIDRDLEKFARKVSALAARGCRCDDEALH